MITFLVVNLNRPQVVSFIRPGVVSLNRPVVVNLIGVCTLEPGLGLSGSSLNIAPMHV